jgi:hypothetical protein
LLSRNEYLAAENRILKAQLKGRLKLSVWAALGQAAACLYVMMWGLGCKAQWLV